MLSLIYSYLYKNLDNMPDHNLKIGCAILPAQIRSQSSERRFGDIFCEPAH